MSDRRRKKLVSNFQYKLIVRVVLYWAIYQVTLFNLLFCWNLMESGEGSLFVQYSQFMKESYPMLICFVVLVPVFAWDSVRFYHRVAGPIVRFRAVTQDIAAERPVRRISLRKGDELTELQDDYNSMLDTLIRLGAVTLIENKSDADTDGVAAEMAGVSRDSSDTEESANGTE